MGDYYFLACLFPVLPAGLGDKLPQPLGDLTAMALRHIHAADAPVLHAHLHAVDTANWEQMDQGRDLWLPGGALGREDMEARRNLPDYLRAFIEEKERGVSRPYPYDGLWEAYYRHATEVARKAGCAFLIRYLAWEVELRNHLVELRAKEKGIPAEERLVFPGVRLFDFGNLLVQIKGRKNPLAAERMLDEERLKQIYQCEGASPFSLDAILAYLTRAGIFSRWERMSRPFRMEDYIHQGGSTWTVQSKVAS